MGLPEAIPRWRTFPFFIYYKRDIFDPILKRSPFIYWYQQYLKAGLEGEFLIKRWVDILYQLVLIDFMTKVIARRGRTTTFAHWYSGEKRGYLKEITEEEVILTKPRFTEYFKFHLDDFRRQLRISKQYFTSGGY
jgi:hypothetical protein